MTRLIFVGLFTEGTTDIRFLESIVKRTFDCVAFECNGDIEIELVPIEILKSTLGFVDQVRTASKKGFDEFGITVLCVHTDADEGSDDRIWESKIVPAQTALLESDETKCCKVLTPIVPIQMIEAWMLADPDLLKREIGTTKTKFELGIHRHPEEIANPKFVIQEAIRIAREDMVKRRRHDFNIGDLYLPIGKKSELDSLGTLSSFQKFKESVRTSFRQLNLLQ
jgi:hypothetical protein